MVAALAVAHHAPQHADGAYAGNLAGAAVLARPAAAGIAVTLWTDTTGVHLLIDGVRLKTVSSRLTTADLRQLLADGGERDQTSKTV
jgi:hypothetical protein